MNSPYRLMIELVRSTALAIVLMTVIVGCRNDDSRTVVRFWHFWSEPRQRAVVDSLVTAFEREHPEIDVRVTILSWGDGKTKLQVAFNAGTPPDLVHLGMDWFAEFDQATSFIELPEELATDTKHSSRWLVNVRAFVTSDTSSVTTGIGGLCVSDPHNVIKRVLPLLWERGSRLYQRLPISSDLNDTLAQAIWSVISSSHGVVRDRSRQLDDLLLQGRIRSALTGAWIIDMAREQSNENLRVRPMRSILNADVLAVPATSSSQTPAVLLLRQLSSYEASREFCRRVSDAGFPTDLNRTKKDSIFTTDPLTRGFLETAVLSRPLIHSARLLAIEPLVERLLEKSYSATSLEAVRDLVSSARTEVKTLESR